MPERLAGSRQVLLGCVMDVVEVTPSFEQYAFTFGGVAPLMRIKPGTALRLWSDDAFCGALRSVKDLSGEKVDLRFVNPQTGPFHVDGADVVAAGGAGARARLIGRAYLYGIMAGGERGGQRGAGLPNPQITPTNQLLGAAAGHGQTPERGRAPG